MTLPNPAAPPGPSIFRNWLSLIGLVVVVGAFFSFVLLLLLDLSSSGGNPYVGILAYLILPLVLVIGLVLVGLGLVIARFQIARAGGGPFPPLILDFSRPRARRTLVLFVSGSLFFLLFAAVASYRSYHFSESVQFCGQACHTVMHPEFTTYRHSPHARVACSECHIGSGAAWYVKAKISGLYQVYAVLFNKFERPLKTPVKSLRPAQETCEQCHWPQKFSGDLDRVYPHFLSDKSNTPFTVRLSLKVGGSDLTRGPVGGIHWHMNVGNWIEYIARDELRQVIPWVRVVDQQGVVTEFQTPDFKPDPGRDVVRRMDCMDCHNRPAHIFQTADEAVNMALSLGLLDATLPFVKKTAVEALTRPYATKEEALQKIATAMHGQYRQDPRYRRTIDEVQKIYLNNFFPEMQTSWKVHPDNLGHLYFPGCFRCHDGEHKTADGKQEIRASDCTTCHVILAQGAGEQLRQLNPQGLAFEHPAGDVGAMQCHECHTGGGQ
ncbi:MAG: NapC/NirT family cytochrome c [Lentisphaerae bacterium]|nr:NapC/NirT family cytochrome c [Lentisphaerota bacterium]